MEDESKTICLSMIVKNESRIIRRCLDSVKGIVDYVYIEDTGSTDNTKELIAEWGEDNDIPVIVHYNEWKNFGHNRTIAAEGAKENFPEADYLLFIDADMVMENHGLDKSDLTADYYMVKQYDNAIEYMNIRLVSASYTWKSVGVTHEYWSGDGAERKERLNTLVIDDRGDGGCKDDKFTRDYALLTTAIEEETDQHLVTRYYFYLAQTCKCLGKIEEAIKYYQIRAVRGGYIDEIWYSMLQEGVCNERLGKNAEASQCYLKAYSYHPVRAESLSNLARMHRLNKEYHLAYCYALTGEKILKPDAGLFLDHQVYSYKLLYELSIVSYYCRKTIPGSFEVGKHAAQQLIGMEGIPQKIKDISVSNYEYYQ